MTATKFLGESAEWVNVKADGDKGYLAKDYAGLGYYLYQWQSQCRKTKLAKSTRV